MRGVASGTGEGLAGAGDDPEASVSSSSLRLRPLVSMPGSSVSGLGEGRAIGNSTIPTAGDDGKSAGVSGPPEVDGDGDRRRSSRVASLRLDATTAVAKQLNGASAADEDASGRGKTTGPAGAIGWSTDSCEEDEEAGDE